MKFYFFKTATILKIYLVMLALLTVACSKQETSEIPNPEELSYPDQEGWNSTVIYTTDGIMNAEIRYGHMQRFKKRKIVEFDSGLEIDFYNEKGEHTTKLTSNKGRLNEVSKDIEVFEQVVVVSDSGINLATEHLWWNNSIEKVVSDEFVTITTAEQDTFYGYGFESDQYLENWTIKQISGKARKGLQLDLEFSGKKSKSDSVTADSLESQENAVIDSVFLKE